ncbi:MAG: signal recognition particle-docking protein FtsY, partial [Chloroflexi bacterium]|nr:signal recognition particle-docking protein FtsY [Chloroflexota bacterium]
AGAPQHVLLVLDAVSGQNALAQAAAFKAAVGVTAVVITKLDSSARGGIVFAVQQALNLPVQFVGSGERLEDLETFNPDDYVARLLAAESQR